MTTQRYVSCILCQRASVVRRIATIRSLSVAANPQSKPDFLKGEPHKRHPGLTHLKTLRLPEELLMAARSIIHRSQVAQLPDRARKLTNFLWSRKRATEDSAVRKMAVSLEKELWEKAMEKGGDLDEQAIADRIQRRVLSELRRTFYHWTPLKYDEELGAVYMAAKMAGGYAAVRRALNEIKKRDPTFAPQSLLDFGSGLGTVAWASHACWSDTLNELVCVDRSGPMNILAERLLKGDDEHAETHIKHVYFRQFLPVSPKHNSQTEKFSYLIMTRERRRPPEADALVDWSRLIAPPQPRTRHVHCHLCRPNGRLDHVVVTAHKHGRDVYRCARSSEWGDQLPLVQDN
ncbi:methyltransferase-like protein 17, mitochondrial isoform X2 [Phycodurus eques]|uniref:methyltransferase-like protein 17, mitochondrial isoform X2 n=1 Tax=Phycodurus eques TaxID=693459 RepID=UPI002ACE9E40|nr:methyltransferase-like protein 17, mitochondrial isoform X2 [Phycodurus eques]